MPGWCGQTLTALPGFHRSQQRLTQSHVLTTHSGGCTESRSEGSRGLRGPRTGALESRNGNEPPLESLLCQLSSASGCPPTRRPGPNQRKNRSPYTSLRDARIFCSSFTACTWGTRERDRPTMPPWHVLTTGPSAVPRSRAASNYPCAMSSHPRLERGR